MVSTAKGLLNQNRDLYVQWVVDHIKNQRLLNKIMNTIVTQSNNLQEFIANRFSQGCANKNQEFDGVSTLFLNTCK